MKHKALFIILTFSIFINAKAQYQASDYSAADSVVNSMSKLIYNQVKNVNAINKTSNLWYKTYTAKGVVYKVVDAVKNKTLVAFDHDKLAQQLSSETGKTIVRNKLSLSSERFTQKADSFLFKAKGYNWIYLTRKNKLIKKDEIPVPKEGKHWAAARDELGQEPIESPDNMFTAYIQEYNLFIKEMKGGKVTQLTFDGSPGEYYSSFIKWSPNSKYVAVNKFRPSEKRFIKFIESSPKDQVQPKLKEVEYLKPGDALPIKQPCLFSIESMGQVEVDFSNYINQFNLTDPSWRQDSRGFTVENTQPGTPK